MSIWRNHAKMKKQTYLRGLGIIILLYLFVLIFDGTIIKNLEIGKKFLQEEVKHGNFWAKIDKKEESGQINSKIMPEILSSEYKRKNTQVERKQQQKQPRNLSNRNSKNIKNTIDQRSKMNEKAKNDQKVPKTIKKTKIQTITNDLKTVLRNIVQRGFNDNEQNLCKRGYYLLKGMKKCEPWLTCDDINNRNILQKKAQLGGGVGKLVSLLDLRIP